MGAMIAALLLDREARSVVLDADPGHGSLSEPLLRLIRVMKSLEFVRNGREYPVLTMSLGERIGQAPYDMPDVFSFFLPEFRPRGPFDTVKKLSVLLLPLALTYNFLVLRDDWRQRKSLS